MLVEHVGPFFAGDCLFREGDEFNAIHAYRYPCNAVALDTTMLCRFSFPKMALLASRMPGLQQQLFRLFSQDIGKAFLLAVDFSVEQRMAAFLVSLSRRYAWLLAQPQGATEPLQGLRQVGERRAIAQGAGLALHQW